MSRNNKRLQNLFRNVGPLSTALRCGRPQCRLCPYTSIRDGTLLKSVQISSTGVDLAIRGDQGNVTCTTLNILYIGTCTVVRLASEPRRGAGTP